MSILTAILLIWVLAAALIEIRHNRAELEASGEAIDFWVEQTEKARKDLSDIMPRGPHK